MHAGAVGSIAAIGRQWVPDKPLARLSGMTVMETAGDAEAAENAVLQRPSAFSAV
jgi:hypothetical protein